MGIFKNAIQWQYWFQNWNRSIVSSLVRTGYFQYLIEKVNQIAQGIGIRERVFVVIDLEDTNHPSPSPHLARVECQRFSHTVPEVLTYIRDRSHIHQRQSQH
jgi:hypothetical protein